MKFQVKALVAAMALSAATVPAQAAMTMASLTGDSSMILTLLDFAGNTSATFDLGYSYSTFPTSSFSVDLSAGNYADAWSSFFTTASAGRTTWAIYAADGLGNGAGARGIISTYKSGANLTNSNQLQTSVANFNSYMNANTPLGNHLAVDDGASVVTTNTSQAFAGRAVAYGATGRINAQGHVSMNSLDTTMTVVQQLNGASAASPVSFNMLGNAQGDYTFNMASTGLLTFTVPSVTTPVPEADSYAMLLAGLGVIGLVARRRKA